MRGWCIKLRIADDQNLLDILKHKISPINKFSRDQLIDGFSIALFLTSLLFLCCINIFYSNSPILEQHAFRQTQTALTSYYIFNDGFSFNYETPVIGKGWSIPFEFPIYQAIVAGFSAVVGMKLTQVGRLVSLAFTIFSCIPIYLMLENLAISLRARFFSLSLYLSAPIYIFWAGTFMIESTALFFCLCFLLFFLKIICGDWSMRGIISLGFFLTISLLQKITTVIPVLATCLFAFIFYGIRVRQLKSDKKSFFLIFIVIALSITIAFLWVQFSDATKLLNPIGEALTSSNLEAWNYGTLSQRLMSQLWVSVIYQRSVSASSLYLVGIGFIVAAIFFSKDRKIKITVVFFTFLFLLPFLMFTNLHIVHNYYQFGNIVYLSIALGVSVTYTLDYIKANSFIYIFVLSIFIVGNILNFGGEYYSAKSSPINSENNKTLLISEYISNNSPPNLPIIVYGYDWSSEIAFYAQRKALTLPWGRWDLEALNNTQKFLGEEKPSTIVLCPTKNFSEIQGLINQMFPRVKKTQIADCLIYSL